MREVDTARGTDRYRLFENAFHGPAEFALLQ